jgi:hypothetical protein
MPWNGRTYSWNKIRSYGERKSVPASETFRRHQPGSSDWPRVVEELRELGAIEHDDGVCVCCGRLFSRRVRRVIRGRVTRMFVPWMRYCSPGCRCKFNNRRRR